MDKHQEVGGMREENVLDASLLLRYIHIHVHIQELSMCKCVLDIHL